MAILHYRSDYKLGVFTRYFAKKINELRYVELSKEIYDKYNSSSGWSNPDIVATLLGGVSAWLGIQVWNWLPYTELVW